LLFRKVAFVIRYVKEKSGAGKVSLAAYESKLLFGKVLINEALNTMLSPRFASSIGQSV
jgi:hypothetical protein